jgi:activator of 2-hydroxyglutaryl-CoA dehydratase
MEDGSVKLVGMNVGSTTVKAVAVEDDKNAMARLPAPQYAAS